MRFLNRLRGRLASWLAKGTESDIDNLLAKNKVNQTTIEALQDSLALLNHDRLAIIDAAEISMDAMNVLLTAITMQQGGKYSLDFEFVKMVANNYDLKYDYERNDKNEVIRTHYSLVPVEKPAEHSHDMGGSYQCESDR